MGAADLEALLNTLLDNWVSGYIRISASDPKRGTTKKMAPQQKKRPAFMEPLSPPVSPPKPLPPLPLSPPPSPTQPVEEEEETPRPTIAVDLPPVKRKFLTLSDTDDIPWVDSFIRSPGFHPDDDLVVANKRYQREEEQRRWEEEEEDDGDGWNTTYFRRQSYWTPPKDVFTAEKGHQMVTRFTKLVDAVNSAPPADINQGIERFLDALVCSDYMDEFLCWAPKFRGLLEAKLTEFINHPTAPLRILGLCQVLRDRHF